jgi:hypothetical protein
MHLGVSIVVWNLLHNGSSRSELLLGLPSPCRVVPRYKSSSPSVAPPPTSLPSPDPIVPGLSGPQHRLLPVLTPPTLLCWPATGLCPTRPHRTGPVPPASPDEMPPARANCRHRPARPKPASLTGPKGVFFCFFKFYYEFTLFD